MFPFRKEADIGITPLLSVFLSVCPSYMSASAGETFVSQNTLVTKINHTHLYIRVIFYHFQRILADYVSVELVFHAKAIEYYSQCFENLANLDEEADLEVRTNLLDPITNINRSKEMFM